jgi:hypothetical protein
MITGQYMISIMFSNEPTLNPIHIVYGGLAFHE